MYGRHKVDCTCFNCFRNWYLSQSKNLPSSQPCMKREDYESCKPQFNSQTVTLCKSCDSDSDEPSQKKSKLSDSKGKYHRKLSTTKLPATKFAVDILGSGEVISKSTMQSVSDLSKNKNQIKCSDNVVDISDESSTSSVSCDSDITLPDIISPMSEDTDEKEETTPIDCVPGRIGEDANPEIIDITENIEDSQVLFNYSQEDAVILISDDDDDDGDGEYDDNDDDDEFDRSIKRMDIESSKKPCHQNNIGFVNANVQFSEEESKFFSREIKKEIPDSMADYGIDVSTKHKVKKEEEEEAEEHSRQSENSKVNSLIFDVPAVKLEPSSNDKGSEEALQNVENTQLFHQLLIKQEKPDSQDSVILFKECEESPKLNSIVAKDKPTSIEKKDPLSDKSMKSPIFPSKLGLSSNRFSSSTSDDDDDDDDADNNDDNDDDDDDKLYMCATQVEENLLKEGQLNEKAKKEGPQISRFYKSLQKPPKSSTTPESPKYSSKKAEDLRGSSTKTSNDSLTPDVAKKIFGSANTSTASLSMVKEKSKGKLQKHCWKITDEDSDSDSSMYSMATQVDHNVSLINDIDVDNDDDDDDESYIQNTQVDDLCPLKINNEEKEEFYMKETQVDESFTSKTSKKQHCFLPPVHLKAKVSKKNSTSKPKATNDDDDDDGDDSLFLATTQVDSIDSSKDAIQPADSSFSDFVLAIAATEPSSIGTVSSNATPQQMQCVEKEEHPPDSNFADFLLKLSKDTDEDESVFTKPLPNVKVSEIEPQRLKSKKEIRENFKLQRRKIDNKSKVSSKSPEKSPTKLFEPTKLSIEDSIPPKKKKPSLKNSKISTERVISEGISSAKCQLVERSFFKSLDKTPVKWDKTSSVRVGSSSSLSSDVTLPNADEIKKLGLPLIETPKRRRPLPETLIKNHPEESQDLTRALSPVLDTVSSDGSTQKKPPPPPPPTLPTPPSPPLPLLLPLSPTFTNNQKTNYNSSSSNKTSLTKHPPPSLTPLPLFENINKCFAKDFNSFHIPKIKNSSLKPKSDSTQTTNITPLPYKYNNSILKQTISSDVPKCTPSYPKSSLSQIHLNTRHPTSTTNTSKRVTFAAGNKSIEVSQQPHWQRSTQQQTQTDLLKYLLRWNTKWLQEQNTLQTAPPVVSKDQLFPLLQSYSSYTDYVNVIRPLLLLEVWESVYREYMESISTARILQVACNNVRKASSSYVDYIIYGVVSEMDQFAHNCISDGDFVILKLQVKNSTSQSGISDGNYGHSRINSEYPVFGFVDKITFHRPQCYDEILDNFPDLAILSRTIPNFKIFRAIIKCHYRKLTYCFSKLLKVQLVASLIPFLRQYQALVKFTSNPLHSHILNPSDGSAIITDSAIPVNGHYNTSQKKAISAAAEMACLPISKPYYCLVQGPPGTGKSHTIIGMIQKIKEQKPQSKILLCAPSNGAVDELMRRLIEDRQKAQAESRVPLKFVRIGNPKYIHKDVVEYSLKKLILRNCKPNGVKQSSMLAEKKQYCNELKLNEEEICKISEQPKSSLRDERIRKLRKDQRYVKDKVDLLKKQLENNQAAMSNIEPSPAEEASLERSLLSNADVICGTLSTCGNNRFITRLAEEQFSCIIIDEASQCCELDSLIPLQYKCCKLVLIGDTEQLSPTIISQLASEYNYGQSLFERLCKHYKYKEKNSVILLNVQYRMHPDICKFPNRYIYNNQLISDSVLEARSSNIPVVPYLLFDAQFGSHVRSSDSGSLSNPLEANFTVCLCECLSNVRLVRASLKIAVIAPYKEQKKLLECLLNKRRLFNVDVTTVDGFQGRENDIIIMSCVRAHSSFGNIGFLKNRRRLNVALTRAKFALYIVGHLASLEGDEDWKSLIQDAQDRHLVLRVGYEDQFQSVVKKCIKV